MQLAGIANSNTVDLTVKDDQIVASYGRNKTAKQPKKSKTVQIIKKKNSRRAISGVSKAVGSFRPDLKVRLTWGAWGGHLMFAPWGEAHEGRRLERAVVHTAVRALLGCSCKMMGVEGRGHGESYPIFDASLLV